MPSEHEDRTWQGPCVLFLATNLCSFFRSFQCSICFQKVENNGYATMLLNHQKRMTSSCRRVSGVSMAYFKVKNKALPRTRRFLHRLFVLTYEPMRLLRPRLMKRFLHNLFSREPAYAGTEQHLKCTAPTARCTYIHDGQLASSRLCQGCAA